MNYSISCRMHNSKSLKTLTKITESGVLHRECRSPIESLPSFPLSVGAESSCQVLLPFLPDGEVESARGDRIDGLDAYVKEGTVEMPRTPLLRWSSWAVIRVEAAHWGYVDLDCYVLGAAQDSGMDVTWVGDFCESRAVEEIERCGLDL